MSERTCEVEGCRKPHRSLGYCERHYRHFRRYGDPLGGRFREPVKDFADGTRVCRSCDERLPMGAFSRSKDGPGGRKTKCGKCTYRDADQERERAAARAWHRSNPERSAMRSKAWREANADVVRERQRAYRASRVDEATARYRQWRAENPDKAKAQSDRAWHRRRALLRGVASEQGISVDSLRARDGDSCSYCSRALIFSNGSRWDNARASIEHVVPLSRGGANLWSNVVLACLGCNKSKGGRLLSEWSGRGIEADGKN